MAERYEVIPSKSVRSGTNKSALETLASRLGPGTILIDNEAKVGEPEQWSVADDGSLVVKSTKTV